MRDDPVSQLLEQARVSTMTTEEVAGQLEQFLRRNHRYLQRKRAQTPYTGDLAADMVAVARAIILLQEHQHERAETPAPGEG